MALEDYVVKHEAQLASAFKGKKHLKDVPEDAKLAADRYHIDKVMAGTNYLHGDGLFPLKSNGQLIDLNGKVTADGTSMTVKVNDYLALIDGYFLGDRNLNANNFEMVAIEPADGSYDRIDLICLKPAVDGNGKRQHTKGDAFVVKGTPSAVPIPDEVPEGSILLAKVTVKAGATVITNDDIEDARDWLWDIDELATTTSKIIEVKLKEALKQNFANYINFARTNWKIDAVQKAAGNSLYNGFVDVFAKADGIDDTLSSNWSLDSVNQKVKTAFSIPMENAVGLYHMDEEEGDLIVDWSGKGNHGLIYGPCISRVDGRFGRGLLFAPDGVHGMGVGIDASGINLTQGMSVIMSVNPTALVYSWGAVVFAYQYDRSDYGVALVISGGHPYVMLRGRGGVNVMPQDTLPLNQWSSLGFKIDMAVKMVSLFLNGTRIVNSYQPDLVIPAAPEIVLGADFNRGKYKFTAPYFAHRGYIDEVGIFDTAVDDAVFSDFANAPLDSGTGDAVVVTKAYDMGSSKDSVFLYAEATAGVTFELSRDNGTTWTAATNGTMVDLSAQPAGQQLRVRATIPAGESLDNLSVWW